ncbi:MAG: hypothetical protein LM522_11880 [Candidatus Contendobacter sp.]|nr:hypothetical protein [Candidatus Contendobacter sp.]
MQALVALRKAGFTPGISPAGGLLIEPASRLTDAQRAYIRAHKVLLLAELRAELAPVAESFPIEPVIPVMPVAPLDQDAFEERAAILEFEAGFSRDEAERRARAMLAIPQSAPQPLPDARPDKVCCGDCVHSITPADTDPVYGWRLCAAHPQQQALIG